MKRHKAKQTIGSVRPLDSTRARRSGSVPASGQTVAEPNVLDRQGRITTELTDNLVLKDGAIGQEVGGALELLPGSPVVLVLNPKKLVSRDGSIGVSLEGLINAQPTAAQVSSEPGETGGTNVQEQIERLQTNKAGTTYVDDGDAAVLAASDAADLVQDGRLDALEAATVDHGGLTGLADDDHTQYHTDARGDARYHQLAVTPFVIPFVATPTSGTTFSNLPAAQGFFAASSRSVMQADLSAFTECRLVVNKQATAGSAGSKLGLYYRTSFSTTAGDYSSIGTSAVQVSVDTTNAMLASSWIPLAASAIADVFVVVLGLDGDGATSPTFGGIWMQFR